MISLEKTNRIPSADTLGRPAPEERAQLDFADLKQKKSQAL